MRERKSEIHSELEKVINHESERDGKTREAERGITIERQTDRHS